MHACKQKLSAQCLLGFSIHMTGVAKNIVVTTGTPNHAHVS